MKNIVLNKKIQSRKFKILNMNYSFKTQQKYRKLRILSNFKIKFIKQDKIVKTLNNKFKITLITKNIYKRFLINQNKIKNKIKLYIKILMKLKKLFKNMIIRL